jgi:hypothetical protein
MWNPACALRRSRWPAATTNAPSRHLTEVETAWSDRIITAPKPMRIQTVVLRPGELATPGYNLFAGYELSHPPSIRFTMPESQLHAFETGQVWQLRTAFGDNAYSAPRWTASSRCLPMRP